MSHIFTKKELKNQYGDDIYFIHDGHQQTIFKHIERDGHTVRVEGWAADVWLFCGYAVTAGYSPLGRRIDYDHSKEFIKKLQQYENTKKFQSYKKYDTQKQHYNEKVLNFLEKEIKLLNNK